MKRPHILAKLRLRLSESEAQALMGLFDQTAVSAFEAGMFAASLGCKSAQDMFDIHYLGKSEANKRHRNETTEQHGTR